jgi:hypothetical protein
MSSPRWLSNFSYNGRGRYEHDNIWTTPSINNSPEISLLKAVQEGSTKELPLFQTRLWALNEDYIRIQVGFHDALLNKFRQASQHNYDRIDTSPLANVSEDVIFTTA